MPAEKAAEFRFWDRCIAILKQDTWFRGQVLNLE